MRSHQREHHTHMDHSNSPSVLSTMVMRGTSPTSQVMVTSAQSTRRTSVARATHHTEARVPPFLAGAAAEEVEDVTALVEPTSARRTSLEVVTHRALQTSTLAMEINLMVANSALLVDTMLRCMAPQDWRSVTRTQLRTLASQSNFHTVPRRFCTILVELLILKRRLEISSERLLDHHSLLLDSIQHLSMSLAITPSSLVETAAYLLPNTAARRRPSDQSARTQKSW